MLLTSTVIAVKIYHLPNSAKDGTRNRKKEGFAGDVSIWGWVQTPATPLSISNVESCLLSFSFYCIACIVKL